MYGMLIDIKAGSTFEDSSVSVIGDSCHLIDDVEKVGFNIESDKDLKKVVANYFAKEPIDVCLKGVTPSGEFHKVHGWPEVKTLIEAKRAQIIEINSKPIVLASKILKNESNKLMTFSTKISEEVSTTLKSEWLNDGRICLDDVVKCNLCIRGTPESLDTKLSMLQNWGKQDAVTKQSLMDTGVPVCVELKPGESVEVELSAFTTKMLVRVIYEARLMGLIAVKYGIPHKGHSLWGLDIGQVLEDCNKVPIVQDLELSYLCKAVIKVKNLETKELINHYLGDHPYESPSEL